MATYLPPWDEVTIAQAVRDIQAESHRTERDALTLLASLVEDGPIAQGGFGKNDISPRFKRRAPIRSSRADLKQPVDATITSTRLLPIPQIATMLRKIARDGWSSAFLAAENEQVPVKQVLLPRLALIAAFEAQRLAVPGAWFGARDSEQSRGDSESASARRDRLLARAAHLKAEGVRGIIGRIAKEERVTETRIKQILRLARQHEKAADTHESRTIKGGRFVTPGRKSPKG